MIANFIFYAFTTVFITYRSITIGTVGNLTMNKLAFKYKAIQPIRFELPLYKKAPTNTNIIHNLLNTL